VDVTSFVVDSPVIIKIHSLLHCRLVKLATVVTSSLIASEPRADDEMPSARLQTRFELGVSVSIRDACTFNREPNACSSCKG